MDNLALTIAPLIAASINAGTPLMLAALGLLVNEKAGVVNLGAEGMMLVSAITGFAVAVNTGSPTLGFLAGAGASMVLSGFFAWLTVWLGTNQYATGLALSLFGAGASTYIGLNYVGNSLHNGRFGIPFLEDIPVLGPALFRQHPMVYLSLLLCLAIGFGSSWLATILWNLASQRLSASLCGQLIVSETLFALVYSFAWDGHWPAPAQWAASVLFTLGILASIKAHR